MIEIGAMVRVSSLLCVKDEIMARKNEHGDYSDQLELVYVGRYDYLKPKAGFCLDTVHRFVKSSLNIQDAQVFRFIKRRGKYHVSR